MTDPTAPRASSGLRALFARKSGALYVQVHAESGEEHRTIVLSPTHVAVVRWLLSPLSIALGIAIVASWVALAVIASRMPTATQRIAELEAEGLLIDTLEAKLTDLQLRYDQVTRMLGASPPDTTMTSEPPPTGSSR